MTIIAEKTPLTRQTVPVPLCLGTSRFIGGLTAPQLRLALVLAGSAEAAGGKFSIDKPRLERMTAVRLDATDRLLEPLRNATVWALPAEEGGEPVEVPLFEHVTYSHGERGLLAGIIAVQLTTAAAFQLSGRDGRFDVRTDELRLYSSVAGIIMRLRLGAMLSQTKGAKVVRFKVTSDNLPGFFGPFAKAAVVRRRGKDGEVKEYLSLAKAVDGFLRIGLQELEAYSETFSIDVDRIASSEVERARWRAVAVTARRQTKRKMGLGALAQHSRWKAAVAAHSDR